MKMAMILKWAARVGMLGTYLLAFALPAPAAEGDARDLVRRVLDAVPKQSFVSKLTVSIQQAEPRELRMSRKYVDGTHGTYLEVTAPNELEGIRFLFLERPEQANEQYIKVKASRTAVRVSEDIRRQPFLGSTFYVSDLVMPELDDYTYSFVGKKVIAGRSTDLVEMVPKNAEKEIYGKTILALDPTDLLILRREFFDKKGKKIKVWTIDKVEKIDGIWTLTDQEMTNLQQDTKSRLKVSEITYNAELPDVMFTSKYLLR